jgi:hypothetical protein
LRTTMMSGSITEAFNTRYKTRVYRWLSGMKTVRTSLDPAGSCGRFDREVSCSGVDEDLYEVPQCVLLQSRPKYCRDSGHRTEPVAGNAQSGELPDVVGELI